MSFDKYTDYPYAYRDVDQFFKKLYRINQMWFKCRSHIDNDQLNRLFDLMVKVNVMMVDIVSVLQERAHEDSRKPKDQAHQKREQPF